MGDAKLAILSSMLSPSRPTLRERIPTTLFSVYPASIAFDFSATSVSSTGPSRPQRYPGSSLRRSVQ